MDGQSLITVIPHDHGFGSLLRFENPDVKFLMPPVYAHTVRHLHSRSAVMTGDVNDRGPKTLHEACVVHDIQCLD